MSLKKFVLALTLAATPALLWLGLPTPAAAAPAPTELKKLDTELGLQAKKGHKGKNAGTKGAKKGRTAATARASTRARRAKKGSPFSRDPKGSACGGALRCASRPTDEDAVAYASGSDHSPARPNSEPRLDAAAPIVTLHGVRRTPDRRTGPCSITSST
jgi:hypothetical protein